MYPDSPYAKPIGSFREPVPLPLVDANAEPVLYIPINCAWFPYIIGALKQLLLQATWDTNDPNALNLVQMRVFTLMSEFDCQTGLTLDDICKLCPPDNISIVEDDMPIFRQEGCLLQTQCADGSWVTIYDPTACIPGSVSQPAPGGDVAPGDCREYDVVLQANSKWSLPVAIDNGDIVTISNAKGMWQDGTINPWHCPDGNNSPLGICVGGTAGFDGADPAPAFFHMRLVALSSVQAYDAFNTTIAIAGYGAPDQLVFQANDSTLSDDAGSISFHVSYCKAAASPIGITYSVGSGPTPVNYGTPFVVASAATGGVEAFDMTFSQCVRLTILGSTGFVELGSGSNNLWNLFDCASVSHPGPLSNSGLPLTSLTPLTETTRYTPEGDPSSPFTVSMKIDPL
jgi:hypothetical protein